MSNVIYKMFNTKATSIDEANFNITFKISDGSIDRQGEIVSQRDWQMANYMANPVLLFGHDPSKPQFVLGKCLTIEYDEVEDCHYGTFHLDADFNPDALLVWHQLVSGTLRTVSIGFISHDIQYKEDVPVLGGIEPVETSIVPIPANAGALAKANKAGTLHEKDARWLMETMRKEADLLEETLKSTNELEKKSMTEEQATAMLDAMGKLTSAVEELKTDNAALKEELAALKPAAETEEEKTSREAKEQEDANVAAGLNPDGSAKSGDNDQDGAETDEFDEDAELSPEQEAEAREALGLEPVAA